MKVVCRLSSCVLCCSCVLSAFWFVVWAVAWTDREDREARPRHGVVNARRAIRGGRDELRTREIKRNI